MISVYASCPPVAENLIKANNSLSRFNLFLHQKFRMVASGFWPISGCNITLNVTARLISDAFPVPRFVRATAAFHEPDICTVPVSYGFGF